jgi:hypothetical protein
MCPSACKDNSTAQPTQLWYTMAATNCVCTARSSSGNGLQATPRRKPIQKNPRLLLPPLLVTQSLASTHSQHSARMWVAARPTPHMLCAYMPPAKMAATHAAGAALHTTGSRTKGTASFLEHVVVPHLTISKDCGCAGQHCSAACTACLSACPAGLASPASSRRAAARQAAAAQLHSYMLPVQVYTTAVHTRCSTTNRDH